MVEERYGILLISLSHPSLSCEVLFLYCVPSTSSLFPSPISAMIPFEFDNPEESNDNNCLSYTLDSFYAQRQNTNIVTLKYTDQTKSSETSQTGAG